ncbi:MAG TPA: polymorphic toxin-type HINT domain-containing protein [Candidatus Babeliales bacterium]|nr:polymorphic toxin-type HINT domain-containing protein [Candidatus Babeliales bacterium]
MKQLTLFYSLIFSLLFCINTYSFNNKATTFPKLLTSSSSLPTIEFPLPSYSQEGFGLDTLVKSINGYKPIQDFRVGDVVIGSDKSEKKITNIAITLVKEYVRLTIDSTVIRVGCDQQYCVVSDHVWTAASNLKPGDYVLTHMGECCKISATQIMRKELFLYSFSVEDHIFCIAPDDICVHNSHALALQAAAVYWGYITTVNPIVATVGIATALSSIAHKAYHDYTQRFSLSDTPIPQEVLLAERSYYEQRKVSLQVVKQELLCVKNDLLHIKALCGNGASQQLLQQNNITNACTDNALLKISAAQEMQLSDKQKIDLRTLREADLAAIEQDIIVLQCMLALHCNTVIEQVQAVLVEYKIAKEQINLTRNVWNNNKHNITDSLALRSYKTELIEEYVAHKLSQRIDELKALINYYHNCRNKECLKISTNITDCLQTLERLISQWESDLQKEKSCFTHNMSISAQYFVDRGISISGIKNETKDILEKAQKDNARKTLAQLKQELSSMVSCGGPYKDPKNDKENDQDNKRVVNTTTKTEFFKKVKDQYEHCGNDLYRRKSSAKGIENAEYLRWDYCHSDVEAYTASRKHLGSINPQTLKLYKGPVVGRKPF